MAMSGTPPWFEPPRDVRGLSVHVLSSPKFKVESARLVARLPLSEQSVTKNALVPFVLRRGTRRLPTLKALTRHLEGLYGARLGVEVGKVGQAQTVEMRGEAVADAYLPGERPGTKQLEALLHLLFETLLEPAVEGGRFLGAYVDQEKDVLRRRIEGIINNKRQYAVFRLTEEMFKGTPLALHRLGRLHDLDGIEARSLFEHYQREVLNAPLDLLVVSSAPGDAVAEVAGRILGRLGFVPGSLAAHQSLGPPGASAGRDGDGARQVIETQDVKQGVLALGFRTPVRFDSPDYPAMVTYSAVLGGFPHSKLFVQVRERNSLAYFAFSRLDSSTGTLLVSAGIDPALRERVLSIIEGQLGAMARGEIEESELEASRRGLIRRWRSSEDEPGALLDHYLHGLICGRQRPFQELIADVERTAVDAVVQAASGVEPDTYYFLTSPAVAAEAVGSGEGRA